MQAPLQPQREPPPFTPLPIKTRHPASSQCILEHSHGPLCFPEPLAASPRSPVSSDAPREAPRFSAQLKQMFSTAAWVQVDPRGPSAAPGRLTPLEPPIPPPVCPQRLSRPKHEPYKEDVRCLLPHRGGRGGGPAQIHRLLFSRQTDRGPSQTPWGQAGKRSDRRSHGAGLTGRSARSHEVRAQG